MFLAIVIIAITTICLQFVIRLVPVPEVSESEIDVHPESNNKVEHAEAGEWSLDYLDDERFDPVDRGLAYIWDSLCELP